MNYVLKIVSLLVIAISLNSCGDKKIAVIRTSSTAQVEKESTETIAQVVLLDTVDYVNFDDNGDDFYLTTSKNGIEKSFIYNKEDEEIDAYTKDDILEITYAMDSVSMAGDEELVYVLAVAKEVKKIGKRQKNNALKIDIPEIKIDEKYINTLIKNGMEMNHNYVETFSIKAQDHFEYYKVDNFLKNNYVLLIAYYEYETTAYLTSTTTMKPLVVFYTNEEGCWQTEATINDTTIETIDYECSRENEIVYNTYEALLNGKIMEL